jgi:hypothetical protein
MKEGGIQFFAPEAPTQAADLPESAWAFTLPRQTQSRRMRVRILRYWAASAAVSHSDEALAPAAAGEAPIKVVLRWTADSSTRRRSSSSSEKKAAHDAYAPNAIVARA